MNKKPKKYNHGFTVPEGYFDSLEDSLFQKTQETKLPNETGFTVPNSYFDSVEEVIFATVIPKQETKIISLFNKKAFWFATGIAASILLVLFLSQKNTSIGPNNLEITEIEAYINNGNLELETQDIAQLLKDGEIDELEQNTLSFREENLEDYLLNNLKDTSLLTE